ncbi:MFS transporter [Paracoccaceae bacterium]|nr:MFS transporter [Paracoccaceae bacterium]
MFKDIRIALIFSVVLLDIIGIGIIFPIIPDLLSDVGIDQNASAAFWGGLLSASYAFMQFVFSPTIGTISDIFGRRPVLLLASLLLAVDYLVMGFAETIWILFIGRIVGGLAGGTIVTGTAYLADISNARDKKKNFAIIGAAFGLGFILGPVVGGTMGEISVRAPFFLSALLSFLNFFLCLFLLPETLKCGSRKNFAVKKLNPFFNILNILKINTLKGLFFCFFLIAYANTVYPAIWSFWGREVFGWSSGMIGFTLACYGFLLFIVQAFIIRLQFFDRLSTKSLMSFSLICGIIALFAFGFVRVELFVFVIIPIAALSEMVSPTLKAFLSNEISEKDQGLLQGILNSIVGLTSIIGPISMSYVFSKGASQESTIYIPGAPFLFAGCLFIASLVFIRRFLS